MRILFVLRSEGFRPNPQTSVDHLVRRGHHVTLPFASNVGPPDDQGFREWRARGPNVTAILVTRSVRRAVHALGRLLNGDDAAAAARRLFAATYVRPRGVGAQTGEAATIATELAAQRRRMSAGAITVAIDREPGGRSLPRVRPCASELHDLVERIADSLKGSLRRSTGRE